MATNNTTINTTIKRFLRELKKRKRKQLAGVTGVTDKSYSKWKDFGKWEARGRYAKPRGLFRRMSPSKGMLRTLQKLHKGATHVERRHLRKVEELLGVTALV